MVGLIKRRQIPPGCFHQAADLPGPGIPAPAVPKAPDTRVVASCAWRPWFDNRL